MNMNSTIRTIVLLAIAGLFCLGCSEEDPAGADDGQNYSAEGTVTGCNSWSWQGCSYQVEIEPGAAQMTYESDACGEHRCFQLVIRNGCIESVLALNCDW